MRIALSGSHATGKSSIARTFADLRPTYAVVDEPYHIMASEAASFSVPPTFEDFECQLQRSAALLMEHPGPDVLFERSPIDFLAYLASFRNRDPEDLRQWFDLVEESVRTIDLVAYVPIEDPDRVEVDSDELPRLRHVVDHRLRSFLVNDELGFGSRVIELRGSVQERTQQLLEYIEHPVFHHNQKIRQGLSDGVGGSDGAGDV